MLKIFFALIIFLSSLIANEKDSFFQTNYTFIDASINYLDWNNYTQNHTIQKDFSYLEIEGGSGWDWGEFYGFMDIENPTHSYSDTPTNDLRVTVKPIFDIYIKNGLNIHIQDFNLQSKTYHINNLIVGLSYKYSSKTLWFTPFIAPHYKTSTYFTGFNGYMLGWSFNYDFEIFGEKIALFNWHEFKFNRAKDDYQLNDGTLVGNEKSYGVNGSISLWWTLNKHLKPGVQYRYAKYELGFPEYQSALIYSLKYYF